MSTPARSGVWGPFPQDLVLVHDSQVYRLVVQALKSAAIAMLLAIVGIGAADKHDLPDRLQFFVSHLDIAGHFPSVTRFGDPTRAFLLWAFPINALFYGFIVFAYFSWRTYRAKAKLLRQSLDSVAPSAPAFSAEMGVLSRHARQTENRALFEGLENQLLDRVAPAGVSPFPGGLQRPASACGEHTTELVDSRSGVMAWKRLRPGCLDPERVEILKFKNAKRSIVYRFCGAGPQGTGVIAKRCVVEKARGEDLIYAEALPAIWPDLSPHYYGFVGDPEDERYCWLFLEDVAGGPYSPHDEEHRALAARWLGEMHLAKVPAEIQRRLPNREPAYYLQALRDCRRILQDHLTHNPALSNGLANDLAPVFSRMVKNLDTLDSQWSRLEKICEPMPRALVHGDFVDKNLRIRETPTGPVLLVFDWEYAGWGVPATDLAQYQHREYQHRGARPDLAVYCSTLKRAYPNLNLEDIEAVAACGNVFRLVDELRWDLIVLNFVSRDFLNKPAGMLLFYEKPFMQAMHEVEKVRP